MRLNLYKLEEAEAEKRRMTDVDRSALIRLRAAFEDGEFSLEQQQELEEIHQRYC